MATLSPNLEQAHADIIKCSEICEVQYNPEKIRQTLVAFAPLLEDAFIQFRTTSKPKETRELNYRFEHLPEPGLTAWETAKKSGCLPDKTGPVMEILDQTWKAVPSFMGAFDFDVNVGLVKVWQIFRGTYNSLESMIEKVPALPAAVKTWLPVFKKIGVADYVQLVGVDFHKESMNIYFSILAERTPEYYSSIFEALGYPIPTADMMALCKTFDTLACTFAWNSDKVERVCFYRQLQLEEHIRAENNSLFVSLLDKNLPTKVERVIYTQGPTWTTKSMYIKFEWDYQKSILDFQLQVEKLEKEHEARVAAEKEAAARAN